MLPNGAVRRFVLRINYTSLRWYLVNGIELLFRTVDVLARIFACRLVNNEMLRQRGAQSSGGVLASEFGGRGLYWYHWVYRVSWPDGLGAMFLS